MREINISVENEYVIGSGVVIGAAGSYSDVALKIRFSQMWDGLAKHITWLDANGENPTIVYLTDNNYDGEFYTCLIPAEAKAVAGTAVMSVKGADTNKGSLSAKAEFIVLESVYDEDAEEAVQPTPSVVDQLQAQYEGIAATIADARQASIQAAASETAAAGSASAAAVSATSALESLREAVKAAEEAEEYAGQASAVTGMYRITDEEIDTICV